MLKRLAACLVLCAGCGPAGEGPELTATPAHGSMFGQFQLTLAGDVASLGDIQAVRVGGIAANSIHAEPKLISVLVQGAPRPGAVDVEVVGSKGRALRPALFTYDAPAKNVPATWAAFGASLTQGTQSNGIDPHTQTWGYAAQVAKAAGVFLALPLFKPTFVPPLQPTALDKDCHANQSASMFDSMTAAITDPLTGTTDLALGRLDPTLQTRNFAVGGEKVDLVLHGGQGVLALLEHVVEDPETTGPSDILTPLSKSQIDRLEALDPDVAISADLLANDLDPAVTQGDDVHADLITPLDQAKPMLTEIVSRLGKLHGQYFISNMPSLTFVPGVVDLRARRIASGKDTPESFDAKLAQVDDLAQQYDDALAEVMKPYPNLHLVDFKRAVDGLRDGVTVNGETLTVRAYGGLLSLDQLHFSDTGYAILANVFIDAINATLKSSIPKIDLASVNDEDALSPTHLRALGLSCVPSP